MSTTVPITAAQLLELPDQGGRCELIEGELRMMSPSGWRHGNVVGRLQTVLGHYVYENNLGEIFGAETGFLIARDPDTVRAPDFAFIAAKNLPTERPSEAFWPGSPDLAVEVLSPNDKTGEVDEKIQAWLAAGTLSVWIVAPQLQSVTIFNSITEVQILTCGQTVSDLKLLEGFSCPVADFFPSE